MDKFCEDCIHNEVCQYGAIPPHIDRCNDKDTLDDIRPKGAWIVIAEDNDGVHRICCPFCSYEKGSNNTDHIVATFTNFPKFCENCGAEMGGGAE